VRRWIASLCIYYGLLIVDVSTRREIMEVMIDCRILSLSRINARMETDGWRRVSAARIHSEDFIYGCDAMRCDAAPEDGG